MTVKVLIVDDSSFFRQRIAAILQQHPDLKIVGSADNGQDAIEKTKQLAPDVITMDYEMPRMDGISAVRIIMQQCPTPILMFSSLTYDGARVTLDALDAGALDYLPKSFESMALGSGDSSKLLQDRVIALGRKKSSSQSSVPTTQASSLPSGGKATTVASPRTVSETQVKQPQRRSCPQINPKLIVIGASTGGPVALQQILKSLPANFSVPVLVVQHMPGTFTAAFAERLDRLCNVRVKEAKNGDRLQPGLVLLAPGGLQMLVDKDARSVAVIEGSERAGYRPSVDVTLASLTKANLGKVLAVILTGMGKDGREGCRMLKQQGAYIWTQDEASCVVYGMPMAVAKAGLSDRSLSVDEIGHCLSEI